MKRTISILAGLTLAILVSSSSLSSATSPAVMTEAYSNQTSDWVSMSYQLTVPPKPAVCCQAGFEFHVGMLSDDNSTFVKTTFSYGCQVAAGKACYPPFLDRYIFYVSKIQVATGLRTQYPAGGFPVTPNSAYTVSLTKTAKCSATAQASLTITISNSTGSYSQRICGFSPASYKTAAAGIMEVHNALSCADFPATGSVTQSDIMWNGVVIPGSSWIQRAIAPVSGCSYSLSFSDAGVTISWS